MESLRGMSKTTRANHRCTLDTCYREPKHRPQTRWIVTTTRSAKVIRQLLDQYVDHEKHHLIWDAYSGVKAACMIEPRIKLSQINKTKKAEEAKAEEATIKLKRKIDAEAFERARMKSVEQAPPQRGGRGRVRPRKTLARELWQEQADLAQLVLIDDEEPRRESPPRGRRAKTQHRARMRESMTAQADRDEKAVVEEAEK